MIQSRCLATKTSLLLSILAFSAFGLSGPAQTIGPVTNPANGRQYYLLNEPVTWDAAEATAVALGGHLATIRSSAEQDWVVSFVIGQGLGSGYVWIGLNDRAVEGNFQWTSGDPFVYQNWEAGQPDDQFGEDAVCLSVPDGKWLDTPESFTGFVSGAVIEVIPAPPLHVTLQVSTNATIRWNATSNAQYRVEYSSLLTTNTWTALDPAFTATSTNATLIDPSPLVDRRFYRVIRLP